MVTPIVLELDSDIIPPRYIHVILQTMYTDKVGLCNILLQLICNICHATYPLNYFTISQVDMRRVQPGMQVGVVSSIQLRDAMMLHHIGCFIEFPCLVQGGMIYSKLFILFKSLIFFLHQIYYSRYITIDVCFIIIIQYFDTIHI